MGPYLLLLLLVCLASTKGSPVLPSPHHPSSLDLKPTFPSVEDENDVISDQLTACCQEPADLLICEPASVDISILGSGPLLLPNGIALSFLQRLGSTSNHPAFSYAAHNNDDEENGAELTIVCNPATRACHGQATTTSQAGESFVLEPCGGGGGGGSAAAPMQHVWKQINSGGGSNNNNRPLNQDEQEREETEDEEEEEDELERGDKQAQVNDEGEEREEEEQEQEGLVEGEEEKKDNEEVEEEMVGGEEGEDSAGAITYSIRFYYTPDFANETKDVAAFVDKVVAETNHGYETVADLKVRAAAHCAPSPAPATIKEELDPNLQMKRFTTGAKANVEELRNTADLAVLLVNEFQLGICGVAYHNGLAGGQLLAIVRKSCIEPALKPVPKEERHFSNLARLVDLLLNPPTEGEAAVAKNADGLATISVNPYERPATNGTEVAGRRQLFTKLAAVGDESAGCSDEDEQQVSSSYEQYEEEEEKDE